VKNLSDKWIFVGIGALTILVLIISALTLSSGEKIVEVPKEGLVKENNYTLGSKDAKVAIVEFSDFQCPACGSAHPIIKRITQEYGDKILFVYRHFPLIAAHQYALKAAEAVEAAGEQGKFWEYHNLLFENQENLKTKDLTKYAKDLGLDIDKFEDALKTGKFKDKVTADMDDAEKLGVSSTPTFFINGQKYVGVLPYEKFKSLIENGLRTSK